MMIYQKDILTLDDFNQVHEIEENYFEPEGIAAAELCYEWYLKNPHTIQALFDERGKMIGFVSTNPISNEIYKRFVSGTYLDTVMPAEDILAYENDRSYKLHFCSIALHPDYKGRGYLKKLVSIWIDDLIELYEKRNIRIEKIIGEAITSAGERLSKRVGAKFLKSSDHNSQIYEKEIPQENYIEELKRLVR